MSLVEVKDLHKRFGTLEVLQGLSLTVNAGEVVVLVGPSGCGKSTLLRCLNGLELPTSGSVTVGGLPVLPDPKALQALRRRVGMVFQRFHLFPHLTALQNVMLAPVQVLGQSPKEAEAAGRELLERVHLGAKADAYPQQLSGGQQQRVAIARALAMRPELMLFDEPTSALDPELVGEVLEVMRELARDGMTMCVVTHEMAFAADVAHRVLFMDGGRVLEEGPPSQVLRAPQHPRAREFLARLLNH
ncbi:amino acid ABC transporter ATP-binding protein [Aggregicoccus sp. 17bor-14]|uniref:amino acid ABC transporter ATP-binding protein n=1 Tax=Myxococcaceae TaxID=31 RepID=UPI00129CFFF7|nr:MULTISPECIES: amino acid ABC transporter ATP-binding protein [Myxococcaceae]MBF5046023.1 amino acid ABC transporter ATP-binding protein [Simulacricoccus sp. 17bor-14]MRI91754.1 amino acid ABC transporter ATP-binding protein [Aggregicoccus sp. 17bor-14]